MPEETPIIPEVVPEVIEPTVESGEANPGTTIDVEHTEVPEGGSILSPYADQATGSETPDEKVADIKAREELMRTGIEELIKTHQITLDAQIQMTNHGIVPGIVMIDLKYNESVQEHITNN